MQITPPFGGSDFPHPVVKKAMSSRIGTGDVKCAITDRRDIGKFVARIIADERTLNQTVFIWEDEVTLNKTWAVAAAKLGDAVLQKKKVVSAYFLT